MRTPRTKCTCQYCAKWFPLFRRIEKNLSKQDRKLFDEFQLLHDAVVTDLGAAKLKLAGEWPGWDWLKDQLVIMKTLKKKKG